MSDPLYLICGLGNPEEKYFLTRHNIGFQVIDAISQYYGIDIFKSKFNGLYSTGRIENNRILLLKPKTYMNNSGIALKNYKNYFGISSKEIIIIHDDIDLAFGRIKIKEKGGYGGHKGVKSIMDEIGDSFVRLRIGIGNSLEKTIIKNYVLEKFTKQELENVNTILVEAREIVAAIICHGTKYSMNQFNSRQTVLSV